jgi:hypothetical protein
MSQAHPTPALPRPTDDNDLPLSALGLLYLARLALREGSEGEAMNRLLMTLIADLQHRAVDQAALDAAEATLDAFSERWDAKYPAISPSWRADWTRLTVFFDYPHGDVRW